MSLSSSSSSWSGLMRQRKQQQQQQQQQQQEDGSGIGTAGIFRRQQRGEENKNNNSKDDDDCDDAVVEGEGRSTSCDDNNNDNDDDNDGLYHLEPTIERSLLGRLDVGPFLLLYLMLIILDVVIHNNNNKKDNINDDDEDVNDNDDVTMTKMTTMTFVPISIVSSRSLISIVFVLTLIVHLAVVLMTQWNVSIKAIVGYYYHLSDDVNKHQQHQKRQQERRRQEYQRDDDDDDDVVMTTTTTKTMDDIKSWTHCIVYSKISTTSTTTPASSSISTSSSTSTRGTIIGIAPIEFIIRTKATKTTTTNSSKKKKTRSSSSSASTNTDTDDADNVIAVVKFQDRIFRCSYRQPDQDITLWQEQQQQQLHDDDDDDDDQQQQQQQTMNDEDNNKTKTNTFQLVKFRPLRYPVNWTLESYRNWYGHCNVSFVSMAYTIYGGNITNIHLPPFIDLLLEQIIAPFFLFQIFCVLLWCLDEYWYYAIFTFFALLIFECTMAYNRLLSLQRIRYTAGAASGTAGKPNKRAHGGADRQRVFVRRGMSSPIQNTTGTTTATTQYTWLPISIDELVPGDYISLTSSQQPQPASVFGNIPRKKQHQQQQQPLVVPADILLMNGTAVVDEALLTGESIPQLKRPIDTTTTTTTTSTCPRRLDIDDPEHKESILYGGTRLLVATPPENNNNNNQHKEQQQQQDDDPQQGHDVSAPPGGGITGIVLRTGFETAQGSLLRTMAHAGGSGSNGGVVHTRDTFVFILMLVCFAILAASYVLYEGYNDDRRNRFRLMLHVIIIITSVIPPELPMELSLAITNSVADLIKRCNVYCTEHFRIPYAGLVNICCFDKTGTLTSDEMILYGIRIFNDDENNNQNDHPNEQQTNNNIEHENDDDDEDLNLIQPAAIEQEDTTTGKVDDNDNVIGGDSNDNTHASLYNRLPWHVLRIMISCHSLASANIQQQQRGKKGSSSKNKNSAASSDSNGDVPSVIGDPLEKAVLNHTGYHLVGNNIVAPINSTSTNNSKLKSVRILHRFAFSSKLKRMTVLITEEGGHGKLIAVSKGAPETIKEYLHPKSIPNRYDDVSYYHMSRGRRVLAMAYRDDDDIHQLGDIVPSMNNNNKSSGSSSRKKMSSLLSQPPPPKQQFDRTKIEKDLLFAGFLILDCPLKPESKSVINELRYSGHNVVMITGDAILTAAEVARQVGIIISTTTTTTSTHNKNNNQNVQQQQQHYDDEYREEQKKKKKKQQQQLQKSTISSKRKQQHQQRHRTHTYRIQPIAITNSGGRGGRSAASSKNSMVMSADNNNDDPFSMYECVLLQAAADKTDDVNDSEKDVANINVDAAATTTTKKSSSLRLSRHVIKDLIGMVKRGEAAFCISGDTLEKIAKTAVRVEKGKNSNSTRLLNDDDKNVLLSSTAQQVLMDIVPMISVFARHSPHHKEAVLAAYNNAGYITSMCGDGTNDVGALKRAHVGISILSAPDIESKQRNATSKILHVKAQQKREKKKERKNFGSSHTASSSSSSKQRKARSRMSIEESLRQLREAQDDIDMVELGDASVAAPFTSRALSIQCCKDIIQQGRCTLVTMLSIYKILGINCLVNAMVLSRLFLSGVKQGDQQLTVLGIAVAALFYMVTRAIPLSTLSKHKPPSSVLSIQALLSIFGQFIIHMIIILVVAEISLLFVDDYDISLAPDGPFHTNILNTCTFLITCTATINTFGVNYRGQPYMQNLSENKLLYRTLLSCHAILYICALQIFTPINDLMQLTTLPDVIDIETMPLLFDNIDDDDDDEDVSAAAAATTSSSSSLVLSSTTMMTTKKQLVMLVQTVGGLPSFLCIVMILDTILAFSWERFIIRTFEKEI